MIRVSLNLLFSWDKNSTVIFEHVYYILYSIASVSITGTLEWDLPEDYYKERVLYLHEYHDTVRVRLQAVDGCVSLDGCVLRAG